jgi:hypothetical protein
VERRQAAAKAAVRSRVPQEREAVEILEFTVFLLVNELTLTIDDWVEPLP